MSKDRPSPIGRLLRGTGTSGILPLLIGPLLTSAMLLVTDCYPDLRRFYSVF